MLIPRRGIAARCIASILWSVLLSAQLPPAVGQADEGAVLPPIRERLAAVAADDPAPEIPQFQRHVIPLLGKLGCNGRSCHGSFQGRGGFRLSMFGYAFREDHEALLAGDPARVNPEHPAESLILIKPTDADQHEGGRRYERDGWEYRVLRAWIAAGAIEDSARAGTLRRIVVTPPELVFEQPGQERALRVTAEWSDGTREDVTCLTRFNSHDDFVATVTPDGNVASRGTGDTYVIASYDNAVSAIPVLLPHRRLATTPQVNPNGSRIDQAIGEQLQRLGITPSEICSDVEFLRRVSLDVAGTLPTPEEVEQFVRDPSPTKRRHKVDELLASPAYAVWWTTKLLDVMGLNGPLQLGSTDFGPIMTDHWRTWVERKIRDNLPYDRMVEGMVVAVSRTPGQSYEDYALQMSAYVRKQDPVDFTERDTMPNFWFRGNLATADDKALAFAYTFMGVRLDCAQCHKHPFDRWSQRDFQQFAAIFSRVRRGVSPECQDAHSRLKSELGVPEKLNTAAIRRQTYWKWAGEGKIVPWPEVYLAPAEPAKDAAGEGGQREAAVTPKLLGAAEIPATVADPRRPLMDWLRDPENPYFAQALVNRVWAHYFGRGIVEPADDLNLANPPSNPALLHELAAAFVEHGFDLQWLHREITASDAYQRSWRTNETNRTDERHFSRAMIRRLPAEVALDAILMATSNAATSAQFRTQMKDRRIGVQATADLSRTEFGLAVFGKPLRTINCDCEREANPSLSQAIFVRNDPELYAMLDRKTGWLAELAERKNNPIPEKLPAAEADERGAEAGNSLAGTWVREAFLRTLSRPPSERELTRGQQALNAAENPVAGLRELLWALMNTQEFITNH